MFQIFLLQISILRLLKSLDSEEGQSNRFGTKILPSTKYLNALSQKCKNDNNSSDIIEINHDWIGSALAEEIGT